MTTTETARSEAVAWLVGRLRFEQLLTELQHRTDASEATDVRGAPDVPAKVAA